VIVSGSAREEVVLISGSAREHEATAGRNIMGSAATTKLKCLLDAQP
jgi:hypothetical protein